MKRKEEECEGAASNVDHHHYKRRKIENVENESEETEVVRANSVQQIQEARHQPISTSSEPRNECNTVKIKIFNFDQTKIQANSNKQEVQNKTEENIQPKKVYPIFTA